MIWRSMPMLDIDTATISFDSKKHTLPHLSIPIVADPPGLDLATLQKQLWQIVEVSNELHELSTRLLTLLSELANSESCCYLALENGTPVVVSTTGSSSRESEVSTQKATIDLSLEVSRTQQCRALRSKGGVILLAPVFASVGRTDVINTYVTKVHGNHNIAIMSSQLIASFASMWWRHQEKKKVVWEADMAASTVEIVAAIEQCQTFQSASDVLARCLLSVLSVDAIAVGIRTTGNSWLRVISVAGNKKTPRHGLEQVMNRQTQIGGVSGFPANDRNRAIPYRERGQDTLTVPLTTKNAVEVGAVSIQLKRDSELEKLHTYLQAVSPYIAGALLTSSYIQNSRSSGVTGWLSNAFRWFGNGNSKGGQR